MSIADVIQLLSMLKELSGWLLAAVIVVIIFLNPEKAFLWKSRVSSLFISLSSGARKSIVADNIRGTILATSKKLARENSAILPYDLKVEWVKEESRETFFKNNQVIVRMSHTDNPQRNAIIATKEFVKHGLMPNARRYINSKVLEATDITVIRKILSMGWSEALDYYDSEILNSIITSDDEIKDLLERLIEIDKNGMLIPILLNEFIKASRLIFPEPPDPCLTAESKEFVRYLSKFAQREPGEIIDDLDFNREYFKVGIHLAVKKDIPEDQGIENHVKIIIKGLNKGLETFYIMGLGRNCIVAERLARRAKEREHRITKIKTHRYNHKVNLRNSIKGICVELGTLCKEETESA